LWTAGTKESGAQFGVGFGLLGWTFAGARRVTGGFLWRNVEQRDGGYYIAGTRIGLDSVILAFKDGESPEAILESFPMAGPLVRIYGAITFYLENTEKVERYLRDQEGLWAEVETMQTKLPDALSVRLRQAKDHADSRQA
jgi:uncharacterized protein (DUF433 family)